MLENNSHEQRILLISPPALAFYNIGPNNTSMGVLSIKTYLEHNGICCDYINANYIPELDTSTMPLAYKEAAFNKEKLYWEDLTRPRWQALFSHIEKFKPTIIAMTCIDLDIRSVKVIAKKAKELFHDVLITIGGPSPTMYPEIFKDCPEIDLLINGEGELTMLEIVSAVKKQENIYSIVGVSYFKDGTLHSQLSRPHIGSVEGGLDSLPLVNREFAYFNPTTMELENAVQLDGLLTSRGCAFACNFCCASGIWGGKIYYRSIDTVIDEMIQLRQNYGNDFNNFNIHDDNFVSSLPRVKEFCDKIIKLDERFLFRCFSRVRPLKDDNVIYQLIKAGCTQFHIGVESGSDYILKTMNKKLTVVETQFVAEQLKAYDMLWRAFFILGTPYERIEDLQASIELIKTIKAPIGRTFCYHPYLGSKFFDILPSLGIEQNIDKFLNTAQDINEYIGNLIPKDRFDVLFHEADALARQISDAWEKEYTLSSEQIVTSMNNEKMAIVALKSMPCNNVVIGQGRNIRWLASIVHTAMPERKMLFIDLDYPDGRNLAFASFISLEKALSMDISNCIYFQGIPEKIYNLFSNVTNFELDILNVQEKLYMRRICEILRDPIES